MVMSNKHVFWQALIVAFVIFWTGILLGIMFENARTRGLESFYFASETDTFDILLQQDLINSLNLSCGSFLKENIKFADRIYFEAKELEKYDSSAKITDDLLRLHKRYDLLRIMLWRNLIEQVGECSSDVNVVIYMYQYNEPSINTKAKQSSFSSVLLDLKGKYGDKVILIPIAYDTGVNSLVLLREKYDLNDFPVILINQKNKITEISSLAELEKYLT